MPDIQRIFLSHAFADKALADLLRETLLLGGVPEDRIYYSSDRSTGIASGADVGATIRTELQQAGLIIELVSETFLTRPMCLMELGGAWALSKSTYPTVVPPLARDEAVRQIGNVQMGVLGTKDEVNSIFDEPQDRLFQELEIRTRAVAWNQAIGRFRDQLPSRLQEVQEKAATAPVPPQVSAVAGATPRDGIGIANVTVLSGRFGTELHGEATNRDPREHSASLKATFYGRDGAIVGTAEAVISQLGPGQTKTFTMIDIPEHTRRKVEVDTLL